MNLDYLPWSGWDCVVVRHVKNAQPRLEKHSTVDQNDLGETVQAPLEQVGKSHSDDAAEEGGFEVSQLCLWVPSPAVQSDHFFVSQILSFKKTIT